MKVDGVSYHLKFLKERDETLVPLVFSNQDGVPKLLEVLAAKWGPERLKAEQTLTDSIWWNSAQVLIHSERAHEALAVAQSFYHQCHLLQESLGIRWHKGTPLVLIADCYRKLGFIAHAKRYLMLTLCEDAVQQKGQIDPAHAGVYHRLIWYFGMSDQVLREYAKKIWAVYEENKEQGKFAEFLLSKVDLKWMVEYPASAEVSYFHLNKFYLSNLLENLGDGTGRTLEALATYVLSCMAGCRISCRRVSHSTEYDLVASMEGTEIDFRSEMGRYFICECKDWAKPADFTTVAKFCRVLDSTKCRFGILFSKSGITGRESSTNAAREIFKVFQDRGMVILVIDGSDLELIRRGHNFISMLREKYEHVRLDLRDWNG